MRTHQASQKKSSVHKSNAPTPNPLASQPFAVQAKVEESERAHQPKGYESTLSDFAILNPDGGKAMPVQFKLAIGAVGDKYEQEADRVAKQVVQRMNASQSVQLQQEETVQRQEMPEDEEKLQMKPEFRIQRETIPEEEDNLQMKPTLQLQVDRGGVTATPELESSIQQLRGSGQPLSEQIRVPMERAFGADFSGVKVHSDAHSDRLNRSIQAKAFTTGQDIFFRQGAYEPGSRGGQELIAHELTHVVQQSGGTAQRLVGKQEGVGDNRATQQQVRGLASSSSADDLVQRKFGFEVELQLALTKKVQESKAIKTGNLFKPVIKNKLVDIYKDPLDAWNEDPHMTTEYPTVADAGDFEIKVDHNSAVILALEDDKPYDLNNDTDNTRGAIVELVTKPMDENLPVDQVEQKMQKLVNFANAVNYGNNGRKQLNTIGTNNAPDSIYVGMNYKSNYQRKGGQIQATHGIKLEKINTLLTQLASKGKAVEQNNPRSEIWSTGAAIAQEYMNKLPVGFPVATDQEKNELLGLLSLIGNYLVAQKIPTGLGWGKNKLSGLFYKSKLSDVANGLSSDTIRTWLDNESATIADDLVVKADVKGLLITESLTCEEWIEQVLKGQDDEVYEENKNPYAKKPLGPELVGPNTSPGQGAVIENRVLSFVLQQEVGTGKGTPVDKWISVAKAFHALTTQINA
ncbi:MAG: hypothetical protein Fur006_59080 [Coleofasciculaceae cyanobacterium]